MFYNFSLEWLTDGNDTFDPTEVNEKQDTGDLLNIYPVPASSFIMIEAEGMQTIHVYDTLGQLVKTVPVSGVSEARLEVSEWASGVYFVEAISNHNIKKSGKFVK